MSDATVEIDFFRTEKRDASAAPAPLPGRAGAPLRGIQRLVSRINPHVVKTVMACGAADGGRQLPLLSPSSPTATGRTGLPQPLLHCRASRYGSSQRPMETAPLTIFYNGTVAAFDLPPDQAEVIIKMAETTVMMENPVRKADDASLAEGGQLDGDLPIARKKSLQRFLEKRKERLTSAAPSRDGTSSY